MNIFRKLAMAWAKRKGRPGLVYRHLVRPSPREHADFLRDSGTFRHIGPGTEIMLQAAVTDPYLTHIGSHTYLSSCSIFAHDGSIATLGKAYDVVIDNVAPVRIGDYCFIGHGALIMPGARIGDRSVIGAGAVVKGDIPDGSVVAGVPGRVIGSSAELATRLEKNTSELPWMDLLSIRTPQNFQRLEPELRQRRIEHFFGDQGSGRPAAASQSTPDYAEISPQTTAVVMQGS